MISLGYKFQAETLAARSPPFLVITLLSLLSDSRATLSRYPTGSFYSLYPTRSKRHLRSTFMCFPSKVPSSCFLWFSSVSVPSRTRSSNPLSSLLLPPQEIYLRRCLPPNKQNILIIFCIPFAELRDPDNRAISSRFPSNLFIFIARTKTLWKKEKANRYIFELLLYQVYIRHCHFKLPV